MLPFNRSTLEEVRHQVPVRETHPLGQARGTGRVHEERKVQLGMDPRSRVTPGIASAPEAAEVLQPTLLVAVTLVTDQYDAVLRYASILGSFEGDRQALALGHQGFRARVLELEGQLLSRVGRIGRRDDGAGPESSESSRDGIDRVGSIEGNDVTLLPVPNCLEPLAKFLGRATQL